MLQPIFKNKEKNMKKIESLELKRHGKFKRFLYWLLNLIISIPIFFQNLGLKIWKGIKNLGLKIKNAGILIHEGFTKGSWKTRVSYFILGFGNFSRKQIFRGILFFGFQVLFVIYMIFVGAHWLSKFGNLGSSTLANVYDPVLDTFVDVPGDNSFKILLYGLLTIFFIIAYLGTWYINVKQNKINDEIIASGKKIKSGKDDLKSLVDDQFHKTMLALPITGILLFTVLPIVFMVLVAFTNYDYQHDGYKNLFTWVGLNNFNDLVNFSSGGIGVAFGEILAWTMIWAIFATFTNYFLGMFVAIMINKRGIKFKKVWRTILVLTIAIPQFISLLYISKLFSENGLVNSVLLNLGWIDKSIGFFTDPTLSKVMVILINIWVGIPYLMLITTGILMNIPQDLYESAKIDGANIWHQYTKITLPYMLFVTGPYLLTSFIGNINNFNVIYLLTKGGPANEKLPAVGGVTPGHTDLLITWLFNITTGVEANYKLASVIGILIFVVVAVLSLIVYNVMPSIKNEEDFS